MEVLEVTGTDYSTAIELPVSRDRPIAKHQKSPGGNGKMGGKKNPDAPRLAGKALGELQKADQATTEANRMILWLHQGKRTFVRVSEFAKVGLCHDMTAPPRTRTVGTREPGIPRARARA